jgi:hypothetical protein
MQEVMKRTILIFVISALVLASTALWYFTLSTVMQKAAALSYFISLYIWVFMIWVH